MVLAQEGKPEMPAHFLFLSVISLGHAPALSRIGGNRPKRLVSGLIAGTSSRFTSRRLRLVREPAHIAGRWNR